MEGNVKKGIPCPWLVCAATREEVDAFGLEGAEVLEEGRLWRIPEGIAAVTGVGVPVALLRLVHWIGHFLPGAIMQTGIAGAYPRAGLALGDIVTGTSEVFADLGMELPDREAFRPLSEYPFADEAHRAPMPLWVPEWAARLKHARAATVNTCSGTDPTGTLRRRLFGAGFESMEGAAVALAARERGIPVCEIRAVSNYAARRDMRSDNVRAALKALRVFWSAHREFLSPAAARD